MSIIWRISEYARTALWWVLLPFLCAACAGQKETTILLRPDPIQDSLPEQASPVESWRIIDSQDGAESVPVWVQYYLNGNIRTIEAADAYGGRYVFIAENRGDNVNALRQWADGFTIAQDLPQLIAQRVEKRFVAGAALYPDDEYGEYFANVIKAIADGEYSEAVKEQTFWVKQSVHITPNENDEIVPEGADFERYVFLVLISISREALHKNVQAIMANIKTTVPPGKNQAAAIKRINEIFFEEF